MSIIISSGESSNGIIVENDSLTISFGGQATETTANDKGGVRVYGAADTTTINEGGSMFVYQGGVAGSTTVNAGGRMYVNSGGTASAVAISENGFVDVSSGGTANGVEAADGGSFCFAAAPGTDVQWTRGGSSFEMKNGIISGFSWVTGRIQVSSGGVVNDATLNANGVIWVSSGGVVNDAVLNADGRISVSNGGFAHVATVNDGGALRLEGGTAATVTVNAGGMLSVSQGAKLTGQITIETGAYVSAYEGAVIDFDISQTSAGAAALLNDLSLVKGAPTFTITLDEAMPEGTYNLAAGATGFAGTILVKNTLDAGLGGITVGGPDLVRSGKKYTLTLTEADLAITISADESGVDFSGDLTSAMVDITSGMLASSVNINTDGHLNINESGTASAVTVNKKGGLNVFEGGTAHDVMENGGAVYTEEDTTVTFVPNTLSELVLNEGESATVHSGTTATDAIVNYHGKLAVFDGGIVNGVVANSGGSFGVFSGGTALQAVENGGFAYDEEGATVTFLPNSFTGLALNDSATVHAGTTATDTTINSNGILWAFSGGIMNSVTVNPGGKLFISGANVQEVKENGGFVYFLESEGSVVTVVPNAFSGLVLEDTSATVHSGTTATDITFNSNGRILILSGGILNGATVNSLGGVYVYDKGDAGAVTVNAGGNLRIFSGATVHDTVINSGGRFDLMSGGYASGLDAAAGARLSLDVVPDTYAQGTYDGSAFEIKDASVSGFAVHSGSELNIYEGGTAHDTVVHDEGQVNVSGGAAEGITVNAGGELYVTASGAAHDIVENGGYIWVEEGSDASFVPNTISGLVLTETMATVHSGTTADKATIGSAGYLFISGGVANGTVIDADGELTIYSGGVADGATVNPDGELKIFSGGVANGVAVKANGWLYVYSGGTATNVDWTPCEGAIYTDIDATVTYTSTYYGVYYGSGGTLLSSAATMKDITLGAHYEMNVMKNGEATGTIVDNDGEFYIFSGGTASSTTVKTGGWVEVSSGAVAADTDVQADCTLLVMSGGKVTGNLTVADGTTADFHKGGILDFDLTKTTAGAAALVNGLSFIEGAPTYTLTVEGGLADGTYSLASGATGFDGTILVNKTLGDSLGSLTVGGPSLIRDGKKYTLTLTESDLAVTIAADESGVDFSGDLTSATVDITSGMVASSVNINTEGKLNVYDGGVASVTTVNFGGDLYVSSGGKALQIKENGGYVNVDDDAAEVTFVANSFSGLTLYGLNWATVHSGTTATDIVANSRGTLQIYSGGLANNATANSNGRVYIYDGGTVNNAVINPDGMLVLSSGGSATGIVASAGASLGLTVAPGTYAQGAYGDSAFELKDAAITDYRIDSGCWLGASAGGVVSNTTVADGGKLYTFDGGIVIAPTVNVGGSLFLYEKIGSALQIKENGGAVFGEITSNITFASNTFSGAVVENWNEATVHSGTTATNATINSNGGLYVFEGGVVNAVVVNSDGVLALHDGGVANDATVNVGGEICVSSGGSALQIRENGGYVEVAEGASATFVANTISGLVLDNEDYATLHSGTTATDVKLNKETELEIYSGGVASAVAVNDEADLSIYDGGIASVVTVNDGGALRVTSGGTVNGVTVNAGAKVEVSSGVISGVAVNAGGNLLIYSGTKITGHMTFESGAEVIPFVGSILDFDLKQTEAGAVALVNDLSILLGTPSYTLTVNGTEAVGVYSLAGGAAGFNKSITIVNTTGEELGTLTVGGEAVYIGNTSYSLSLADSVLTVTVDDTPPPALPTNLVGSKDKVSWESEEPGPFVLGFSTDDFAHELQVSTASSARDILNMPAGTYQWRVKIDGSSAWAAGDPIVAETGSAEPKVLQSNGDGNDDLFFATANGIWSKLYLAEHTGSYNDWAGTNEKVFAKGRNQLADLFFGSNDANILCLTDDANGDAIFLDDEFTNLPESITKQQARIAQIDEIRAGAGDDIVDMTSPRFEYIGSGMTIRGGDGSDVIWANKGSNFLFGDAGNDRITGASGSDVIVGGIGSDRMHGGGGDDVFTFCDNWGTDTVQQLETGAVTLWFASGSETNWNAETLTYTDGPNSVTVKGVAADKITLKFGKGDTPEDAVRYASLASAGAFEEFTSRKIFEESGILASV